MVVVVLLVVFSGLQSTARYALRDRHTDIRVRY